MSEFFIRRPIVAMVIAIITVLIGVVALFGLPIAQFPQILPPQINVTTTYTGADALTIEQAVATPIEQQVNGADRMLYVQSTNGNDGTMNQVVTFDVGTDIDVANVLVNNRFSQAQPFLPQDVKNFGVTIKKSLAFPLMVLTLTSPDGRYEPNFLANYSLININDALLRIKGVGDIRNLGSSEYAMRVWLKPDVLARLGINVSDVQNALRAQNIVNPAGQVGAEPAPPGQQLTYTVRAQGRLVEPDEFANVVIKENADGSTVRVKDVGTVELGSLNYQQYGTLNGKPAAVIAVFQAPGSNSLEVAASVKKTMDELSKRFPAGIEYKVTLDTTASVTASIEEIIHTLIEAIVLVVLVVFVFLQSWRATLIPLLTVPVSLIGTFATFPLLGFSINTLSLFGLVLAIGLVVDDAIVVVEAVEHHLEHGMSPREATSKAMKEVTGPVVAIALILSAVFVPVAFMSGITGRLYQQFALTIAISVCISAFNALTLSPALCALLLKPRGESKGILGAAGRAFNRAFGKATDGYVGVNRILVRKLIIPIAILGAMTFGAQLLGKKLPTGFVPEEDQGYGVVAVQLPEGASMQRTRAVYDKIADVMGKQKGIKYSNGVAGFSLLTRTASSYSGTLFFSFEPWSERHSPDLTAAAIIKNLNIAFSKIPEARIFAISPPAIPGISAQGGFSMMLQDRSGQDMAFLAQNVGKFVAEASKRPELTQVRPNFSPAVPQLFADVDKEKALKQGVALTDVYSTLQTFLGGAYTNDFSRFGRQWKVFLQADSSYRTNADDIKKFYVRNNRGEMVPLSSIVSIRTTTGPEYTVRFNLYRSVEISGAAAPGYSSGQALAALEDVAKKVLPPEMGYEWNALSYQEKVASGSSTRILGLSLIFVFLILAALYESWSLPFSVLLSVPVAVLGAFFGLLSRQFDNNVYAQIGLVMLIGLTAKNAILIVEFAKLELDNGRSVVDAALEGARLRLRPILMTSLAFIFGCLPLWRAAGAGASARRTLGTVVVSGMVAATALGIFLIPALFVLVEKLFSRKKKTTGGAQSSPPAAPHELPPVHADPISMTGE
ncbi:RND efflux system, inner membrane transporter CmeB [Labilithrix luteola]|uniref:RND efflux system, inner membrane transporter CmeB n=1 Tax=Labilithrix luteola TaxID=1391654 RepID=A0A0K1QDX7_9BACT|nr:multidrug efflux RND transporter permease subunit [Labilithrix luteola]AKV03635.1 RND efflux system, inner membrane transporter CmeB [Labilithrix luteola]